MKLRVFSGLVLAAAVAGCTVVVPGGPDGGEPKIVLDSDRAGRAAAAEVADGERADRGQPAALVGQPRRQVHHASSRGSAHFLEGVGLKVENIGLIATLCRPVRAAPAARATARDGADQLAGAAGGAGAPRRTRARSDYNVAAAVHRRLAGQHQQRGLAAGPPAAGVVGQLRRRQPGALGSRGADQVRAGAGRRGAAPDTGRHRSHRAVRQAARSVHRHLPAAARAALRGRTARRVWSTDARPPTS